MAADPIQQILDDVLARGRGHRVTLRLSAVLEVRYESCAPGIHSLAGPSPIDLETQPVPVEIRKGNQVVQDDCAACFPELPQFHAMLANYGEAGRPMTAQIVTPVQKSGAVVGALSLHLLDGPRAWSADEKSLCADACARIAALLP
jgi:GAF domain-containing protein